MILDSSHVASLLTEDGFYDCRLANQLFSYKLLRDKVSPLGDVFCFEAPTVIGPIALDDALVVAAELPRTEIFGGACFQRLYASQLGTLITLTTGKECWLDQNCLFVDNKQASIVMLNQIKSSVVFNIIFPIKITSCEVDFFNLCLNEDNMQHFKTNVISSFRHLTETLFIETCRDNF